MFLKFNLNCNKTIANICNVYRLNISYKFNLIIFKHNKINFKQNTKIMCMKKQLFCKTYHFIVHYKLIEYYWNTAIQEEKLNPKFSNLH